MRPGHRFRDGWFQKHVLLASIPDGGEVRFKKNNPKKAVKMRERNVSGGKKKILWGFRNAEALGFAGAVRGGGVRPDAAGGMRGGRMGPPRAASEPGTFARGRQRPGGVTHCLKASLGRRRRARGFLSENWDEFGSGKRRTKEIVWEWSQAEVSL